LKTKILDTHTARHFCFSFGFLHLLLRKVDNSPSALLIFFADNLGKVDTGKDIKMVSCHSFEGQDQRGTQCLNSIVIFQNLRHKPIYNNNPIPYQYHLVMK